ncbi:MAG: hypothetical protein ACC658_11640 [Acidimicrobiia bacterium]
MDPKIYLYSDRELAGTLEARVWTVVSPSEALAEIHTTAMSLAGLVKVGYSRRWLPIFRLSGSQSRLEAVAPKEASAARPAGLEPTTF